ncbi:MAG: TlpA disulfide reductase family protein [Lacibacter sp.]
MRKLLLTILVCLSITVNAQTVQRWKAEDLLAYAEQSDSALVINFWATYCSPCIAELPWFHTITARYKSQKVKLLLVSLDFEEMFPQRIIEFARKRKYSAKIVWLDEEKPDEFCPKIDKRWTGSMPATLFFNKKKGYRNFIEAEMKPSDLEKEIRIMLGFAD